MARDLTVQYEIATTLDDKIGEGSHREVYRFGYGSNSFALKILKPYFKRGHGIIRFTIPNFLHSLYKTGRFDFNVAEYHNYQRIIAQVPEEMSDSFAKIFCVEKYGQKSVLIEELVKNYDGTLPRTLKEHGPLNNLGFWQRIRDIENLFLDKDMPYFLVLPETILIRKLEKGNVVPLIVDYKYFGIGNYPFQPNLLFRSERQKKIKRKFSKLREKYKSGRG